MESLRKKNAEPKKVVAEQTNIVLVLQARIAQFEKTSRNSSKPPSSDFVKPQTDGKKSKRNVGAQAGHQRLPLPAEKVDEVIEHELVTCSDCGHSLQATGALPKIWQQIELIAKPIAVTSDAVSFFILF
ncbi:hypothetical protein FACS189454_00660 [Planctomycetales bacterium]|nr:hypothetical protein FACS189454_00660 [Planctomycetales bacterium]